MNGTALLTPATADRYAALVAATAGRTANRLVDATTPTTDTPAETLRQRVDAHDLDGPGIGAERALREIDELVVSEAVWFHHPDSLAHLNCPVTLPAVAAETVLAAVNTSVDTYDQSRIGTFVERRLVTWLAGRIGFTTADATTTTADGVFTSGGSQSNLQALFVARERTLAARPLGTDRSTAQATLVVFATAESHFSVRKSALLLGLADEAVVDVATDRAGRMRPDALERAVADAVAAGRTPCAVVAPAGTTDRGCIDPLADIADVCREHDVWLHVDAAYGCGLLVSRRNRHLLAGIERASSVTADLHKSFFQPVSSSVLVIRDRIDLARTSWHADYLNPEDAEEPNQVDKSLQTTRRFDALKLWATLRADGPDAVGDSFDRLLDLAQEVHAVVDAHPDLDLVAPTELSTVLFRWQPDGVDDATADAVVDPLRRALLAEGRVLVARTTVDGRPCSKLTLLNPTTTVTQVARALDHVVQTATTIARTAAADHTDTMEATR